jgi:hypothetical protein
MNRGIQIKIMREHADPRIEIQRIFLSVLLMTEIASWMWRAAISSYRNQVFSFHRGLSYIVDDPTYVPHLSVFNQQPLFGAHYFGDLQGMFLHGAQRNPYGVTSVTQIPPFGNIWASALYVFGRSATAPLYIAISLILPALLLVLWFKKSNVSAVIFGYCALVLANVSTYNTLDRGSMLLIVVPFVGFGMQRTLVTEKYDIYAVIAFAIAISNKPYIACIFIFFLCESKWLFTIKVAAVSIAFNIISMIGFTGNALTNFERMKTSMSWFNSPDSIREFSMGQAALFRVLSDLVVQKYGSQKAIYILTNTPHLVMYCSVLWFILVASICINKEIPLWIRFTAALSTMQLVVAASPPYTRTWTMLAGMIAFQSFSKNNQLNSRKVDYREWITGGAIVLAIIVSAVMIPSYNYSPRVWLVTFVLVRLVYGIPMRERSGIDRTNVGIIH